MNIIYNILKKKKLFNISTIRKKFKIQLRNINIPLIY